MVRVHAPLSGGFLSQERADELAAAGLFADDPAGLAAAWPEICDRWGAAVARARRLPEAVAHERVADEWSFVETLRHLLFVTDAWVGEVVSERTGGFHPWGLPPHFVAEAAVGAYGLDVDARPSLDEVLGARAERQADVARVIGEQTSESLLRTCAPREGRFQVVGALQTVLHEELAHLSFAARDLAVLEGGR